MKLSNNTLFSSVRTRTTWVQQTAVENGCETTAHFYVIPRALRLQHSTAAVVVGVVLMMILTFISYHQGRSPWSQKC